MTGSKDQQLLESLKPHNVEPLWTVMSAMVPPTPKPKASPYLWNYKDLKPLLIEAGEKVSADEAERRVLMLINPSLKAPQTTDTLYAGLQLIKPGETAPAHRHTAFALRFIVEGNGGFTAVGGERVNMERGDVILTPRWKWHDHGKDGNGPMIWLDGLDLPIFQSIPVNFAEGYESDRYPSELAKGDSVLKYPWADVQKSLDSLPGNHAIFSYNSKEDSTKPISTIIGAQSERVDANTQSPVRQETSSFVFHVYEGQGHTVINLDGKETKLSWTEKDTFCVPSWAKFYHVNEGANTAYLFSFSDAPLLNNLGFYRVAQN